jgi:hypothetical protein
MVEVIDVMEAFSTPLKIAWGVWLTWGVAQVLWYRQERRASAHAARPARLSGPPAAPRMSASVSPTTVPGARPVQEPIAAPVAAAATEWEPEPWTPSPGVGSPAPALEIAAAATAAEWELGERATAGPSPADTFNPSQAVIETFSAQASELDSFVASLNRGGSAQAPDRAAWPEA